MIETLAYFLCVLGFAGFSYKLIEARDSQPARTMWFLSGFGICIALGILVLTPAMEAMLGPGQVFEWFAQLTGDELRLGAIGFAVAFAQSVWWGQRAKLRRHAVFTIATMVILAVAFALSRQQRVGEDIVFAPDTVKYALADKVIFLAYSLVSLGMLALVFGRGARHAAPGLLRAGMWLLTAGVVAAAAWTFWDVDDVRLLAETGRIEAREDVPSAVLAACTIGLIAAGATLSAWSPTVTAVYGRFRAYRLYRRIEPLWTALRAAVPGIALDPGHRLPGGAEFALYRRVIEIRDGHLALRPHFDPALPGRVEADARRAGVPEQHIRATVEAASLAAALLAEEAGRRYQAGAEGLTYLGDADVAAEAAWLVQVAKAWQRCDLVEQVRAETRQRLQTAG
ncbi:MAG TPA: MAB_1171c family putative transporter [Amycolatopsis sp.]|nr:MAB_1171c family putative transporter [Amycolatopsis sp.]